MVKEKIFYKKKIGSCCSKKSTYALLKPIVILGQCFALLPVGNILAEKPDDGVCFKWKSFKIIYSVLALIGAEFMAVMALYHISVIGYTLKSAIEVVFYGSAGVTIVLFILVARSWANLITTWTSIDLKMERAYGYSKNLERKLKIIILVVMIIATVEHQFSVASHIETIRQSQNATLTASLYYKSAFKFVFEHLNYSIYMAVFVQVLSILSTFAWTYNDLFIIVVSTVLVARFQQVTKRLTSSEETMDVPWREIREDYNRLCHLCNTLNSVLSSTVLLTYFINIFFILAQLYNSLGIIEGTISKVYFFYSFGFLIFKTLATSLCVAKINDESKEPVLILLSVPSYAYNTEVERFLLQISFDNVALTGCKFFNIKRGLILTIAGAIVTYELVLLQLNTNNK